MADMWQFEVDPAAIPATPWRCYRLYAADGRALAGYYSVGDGKFKDEGRLYPLDRSLDKTVEQVQEEIAKYAELWGTVTLRALSNPTA